MKQNYIAASLIKILSVLLPLIMIAFWAIMVPIQLLIGIVEGLDLG